MAHGGVVMKRLGAVRRTIVTAALAVGGLPAVAIAQPPARSNDAIYDINRLNGYTARVGWRIVYNVENSTAVCRGEGSAIFLGGSLFLTAAHVVDQNPKKNECAAAGKVNPFVEFGSTTMEAKIIAIQQWDEELGSIFYADGMDLGLLEVDKRMMQPELRSEAYHRVCESDLNAPGTEVKVSTEYGVYDAMTLPGQSIYSRLDFAAKHGDSGGGVFDERRYCLLVIISSGGHSGSTYVTTQVVRRFLDQSMRSEH